MQESQYTYRNSTVGYCHFGSGPNAVVGFHGFGEQGALFGFLERYADHQFFCIDLPFHGNTDWKEGDFTVHNLVAIVEGILERYEWSPGHGSSLALLGFSLGGRVALSLYQACPGWRSTLVLLAPDGLRVNPWYWLATQTMVGNRLFSFTMDHPGWFFALLGAAGRLGLVNGSISRFVRGYIGNKVARQLLYRRWTSLRKLRPDLYRIKKLVKENKTEVRLLYGKYDRIILPVRGEQFARGIDGSCTITILDCGHQVLHEDHATAIVSAIRH